MKPELAAFYGAIEQICQSNKTLAIEQYAGNVIADLCRSINQAVVPYGKVMVGIYMGKGYGNFIIIFIAGNIECVGVYRFHGYCLPVSLFFFIIYHGRLEIKCFADMPGVDPVGSNTMGIFEN